MKEKSVMCHLLVETKKAELVETESIKVVLGTWGPGGIGEILSKVTNLKLEDK